MRSGRRCVSSRRDSSQGQFSPRKRELFITPGRGEPVTQVWNSHLPHQKGLISPHSTNLFYIHGTTHKAYFRSISSGCRLSWSIPRVQLTVASCRIKSLNGRREQRAFGQGYAARDKYSMRILWRQYFILYSSIVARSHLHDVA